MKNSLKLKRVISFLSALVIWVCILPFQFVSAESGTGWTFDSQTGTLTLTSDAGYYDWSFAHGSETSIVKKLILDTGVTFLDNEAFSNNSNLKSVIISSTVDILGSEAFAHCDRLRYIIFYGSEPPDFDKDLFFECNALYFTVPSSEAFDNYYYVYNNSYFPLGSLCSWTPAVQEIELNRTSMTLSAMGEEQYLTATTYPDNALNKTITWSSSNTNVATVDAYGKVKAVAPGEAIIIASAAGPTSTCSIHVYQPVTLQINTQPINASAKTYGYSVSEAPSISVSASKTPDASLGSSISYQWYRVKSGSESSDAAVGTNSNTLSVPVGLDAGTYNFYCMVSCDGYTVKSSNASFTVDKATPIVSITSLPTNFYYGEELSFGISVSGINGELPSGSLTINEGTKVWANAPLVNGTGNISVSDLFVGDHLIYVKYIAATDGTGRNYTDATSFLQYIPIAKAYQNAFSLNDVGVKSILDPAFTLSTSGVIGSGAVTYSVPANNGVLSLTGDTATILGAGKVIVTAAIAGDSNTYSATATREITVNKLDSSIEFNPSFNVSHIYDGIPLSNPGIDDLAIINSTYNNVTFTYYKNSVSEANRLTGAPSLPGTYVLVASVIESSVTKASSASVDVTISLDTSPVTVFYDNSTTVKDWYKSDVTISATGYRVSDSIDGSFDTSFLMNGEGEIQKTLYFKNIVSGYISEGKLISVTIDKTEPTFSGTTDGISIGGNRWSQLQPLITYADAFNTSTYVSMSATDAGSQDDLTYFYYIDTSGRTITRTSGELDGIAFISGPSSFTIAEDYHYVIYAYAVDLAGNKSAYICSNGFVIDMTPPTTVLRAPVASEITDISASMKVQSNEIGAIAYIHRTSEQINISAQDILNAADKKMISVSNVQVYTDLDLTLSGLSANTKYYIYAIGVDSYGNLSAVTSTSFTTKKTTPTFDSDPFISGTYGQRVNEMTVSQVASNNGVSGTWTASSTSIPSVGTEEMYLATFTPDDTDKNEVVTVQVIPTVTPKNLSSVDVTIGNVEGTITFDGTPKMPTVSITDSKTNITSADYAYSYTSNTNAGTVTLTITGRGNYTGSVSRDFMIAKAAAPTITFPTATAITYGQKLSASTITGGSTEYGTFSWENGDLIPSAIGGTTSCDVIFTPNVSTLKNYEIDAITRSVSVVVNKVAPSIATDMTFSGSIGSREVQITVQVTGVASGTQPTGTVKFVNCTDGTEVDLDTVMITNGTATYVWKGLYETIYQWKVIYSGDENYSLFTGEISDFDVREHKTDLEIFVYDMYMTTLGYEPDETGFKYWLDQIVSGKLSGANFAYTFLFSSDVSQRDLSDNEFISLMYKALFHRKPDAAGLSYWNDVLDMGVSRKYVFSRFIQSSEWIKQCDAVGIQSGTFASIEARDQNLQVTAFVQRLYQTILHRNADVAGLNYWTAGINQKTISVSNVARALVFSSEFQGHNLSDEAYVDALYQGLLGRSADAEGRANWIAQLRAGTSRIGVFNNFVNSAEFTELCNNYGI